MIKKEGEKMNKKKYELTDEKIEWKGRKLYRIRALYSFETISGKKIERCHLYKNVKYVTIQAVNLI